MRIVRFGAAIVLVIATAGAVGCQRETADGRSAAQDVPAADAAGNPVQAEMRLLNEATRDWVTAVAQNDLASIPAGISRVHAARLVTEDALERGEYAPPKGGSAALAAFTRQDEAFHDELVKLLAAAKADDLPAATRQLGVVIEGCTSCHLLFRF